MSTRPIEECQDLAELWLAGEEEEVLELLGGTPSEKFLADFRPGCPHGRPVEPVKKNLKKGTLKLVDKVSIGDKVKAG